MTTSLWCLLIVAVLPYVLSFAGGYFRMQQFGTVDNKHPRLQQAQLEGIGNRALAAQQNAWEALAFFTAVQVVLHLANPEAARSATAANLSFVFLATRIVHPVLYLANIDIARSAVFLIGLVCGGWLLVLA